jgi:hypothetical protein
VTRNHRRLDRMEREAAFSIWFRKQRIFEKMSVEELETLALTGQWPDRPEPAPETTSLDTMNRSDLIKLWRKDLQKLAGRSGDELEFFAIHGHWPETA